MIQSVVPKVLDQLPPIVRERIERNPWLAAAGTAMTAAALIFALNKAYSNGTTSSRLVVHLPPPVVVIDPFVQLTPPVIETHEEVASASSSTLSVKKLAPAAARFVDDPRYQSLALLVPHVTIQDAVGNPVLLGRVLTGSVSKVEEALLTCRRLTLKKHGLTEVPLGIRYMPNLTEVILDHNQLTSLPSEIGSLKGLELLSVANNQLTQIPDWFVHLPAKCFIELSGNKISLADAKSRRFG